MNYYQQQNALMTASRVFNEKWNLLIIHQMFNGMKRFNQIADALSFLSPTLISKRLKSLESQQVVIRKSKSHGSGFEYYLSALGKKLQPLMNYLYQWGDSCNLNNMDPQEQSVHHQLKQNLSMFCLDELPMGQTLVQIHLVDLNHHKNWWFILDEQQITMSNSQASEPADVILNLDSKSLGRLLDGKQSLKQLIDANELIVIGCSHLKNTLNQWLVPTANK